MHGAGNRQYFPTFFAHNNIHNLDNKKDGLCRPNPLPPSGFPSDPYRADPVAPKVMYR